MADLYASLSTAYAKSNPKSRAIHETATRDLPGGNTRSVLFHDPFPLAIVHASGSQLHDADGHVYTDLLGEYTAGIYGHSDLTILSAIRTVLSRGLNYGAQHANESRLAAQIKSRFPSVELIRFTNSGTEATLMALAAARAHTGRDRVVVFEGGYHGGAFAFGHGGGDGKASAPPNAPFPFIVARYNDPVHVQNLLRTPEHKDRVAAILVEPMLGSGGAIPADRVFLEGLRRLADQVGAVLIYDEVMTSRLHRGGGVQGELPVELRPDLTTLGKYMGGGMSFGAFGGKSRIMERFDPRRPGALAHAGTFNNNVLTMAAGRAGLEGVFTPDRAEMLHKKGERLRQKIRGAIEGTLLKVTGSGSIMNLHFTSTDVQNIRRPTDIGDEGRELSGVLHLFLLSKGYFIARRGFIALSLALSDEELDGFVAAIRDFVQTYAQVLRLSGTRERL